MECDLFDVNWHETNLSGENLIKANLIGDNLYMANFQGVNLDGSTGALNVPDEYLKD